MLGRFLGAYCFVVVFLVFPATALEVILPDTPDFWEKKAAEEIVSFCGQVRALGKVYIGRASRQINLIPAKVLEKIKVDGFAIASNGSEIAITGKTGSGTLHGVYGLFRRLGGEIYSPDCIVSPDNETKLEKFCFWVNPAYSMRQLDYSFYYWPNKMRGINNSRMGFTPFFTEENYTTRAHPKWFDSKVYPGSSGAAHTTNALCPLWLYYKDHPEYYSRDENGKQLTTADTKPNMVHICMSNPEVRKIASERLLKWMESCQNCEYFQIADGDNHDWCRCAECRKLDPKGVDCFAGKYPEHLADRMINFCNEVAAPALKKFPDKKILVAAYQGTSQVPKREKPASNIIMRLCADPLAGNFCSAHVACPVNKEYWKHYKAWLKKVGPERLAIFEYIINYKNIYAPFFCLDGMVGKIKRYRKDGVDKIGFNGQPYLFAELNLYVIGKMLWNPKLNQKELERDFLKAFYGPAAGHMDQVLALLREKLSDEKNGPHQRIFPLTSPLVDRDYCQKAYRIFAAAEKAAAGDENILWRVRYAKLCGVLWADVDQQEDEDRMPKMREIASICRDAKEPKMVYRLTSNIGITFEEWSEKHLGFKLNKDTWLDDPRLK